MSNSCITVGVALATPEHITKEVLSLREKISITCRLFKSKSVERFDDPHVTLYISSFPSNKREEILSAIGFLAKNSCCIDLKSSDLSVKGRYIAVSFDKNQELKNLHNNIIESLNPLRDNLIRDKYKDAENISKFTDIEKDSLYKYGYPYAGDGFSPHLTLVSLEEKTEVENVVKLIEWGKDFTITKFLVFIVSQNSSTLSKEMFEYLLGESSPE